MVPPLLRLGWRRPRRTATAGARRAVQRHPESGATAACGARSRPPLAISFASASAAIHRIPASARCIEVPFDPFPSRTAGAKSGFLPRGIDVDSQGVVWTGLAGSGHLASFDRRKCKVLTGETATTGRHCAEGWTLYPTGGPEDAGRDRRLQRRLPLLQLRRPARRARHRARHAADERHELRLADRARQADGQAVTLRIPYPLGFHQRGMDGRIDDPSAGWKGRGLWSANGTRAMWHTETGMGTRGQIAHFQLRPNPLAK